MYETGAVSPHRHTIARECSTLYTSPSQPRKNDNYASTHAPPPTIEAPTHFHLHGLRLGPLPGSLVANSQR